MIKKDETSSDILSYIKTFLFTILFILFVAQLVVTNGDSMNDTLKNKDYLLLNKLKTTFHMDYNRFDVVVFKSGDKTRPLFIKRVIGLPGETIKIEDGIIYINGNILEENYGKEIMKDAGMASEIITLAENEYFVLGDNRNNSMDSRFLGPILSDKIIGNVIFDFNQLKFIK